MKYKWKTRPYRHQVKAVKKLLRNGYGGALLMEPRTGKTKTTIDWLSILNSAGKIDRAVILCPSRVMDVWVEEFHTHSPRLVQTHVWDRQARRKGILPPVTGTYDMTVVIVNYEAFATPGRKLQSGRRSKANGRYKTRQELLKWIGDGSTAAIVLDEAHKIKSPSGKAANMLVNMGPKFSYRAILTGTPVTKAKRIHDLYMQWKFLNPTRLAELDLHTVQDVKNFTGVWTDRNGYPQWVRERRDNVNRLRQAIHKDAFAVKREECFDLPSRDEQVISVDLSPKTAKLYDKIATEMVAEIEHAKEMHTIEASIKLVQTLRLAQITSGFTKTDEGKLIRVGSEKLNVLKELLEDLVEADQKVVIAARFKPDLDAICKLTRSLGMPTFELRGGMKRDEATRGIREFRRSEESSAFVMQPQAGALGIDLSTASRMIWYSLTPSWVDYSQSCDRIALSRNSTTFTYLLARGTVDEVQYQALKTDSDVAKMITENPNRLLRQARSRL